MKHSRGPIEPKASDLRAAAASEFLTRGLATAVTVAEATLKNSSPAWCIFFLDIWIYWPGRRHLAEQQINFLSFRLITCQRVIISFQTQSSLTWTLNEITGNLNVQISVDIADEGERRYLDQHHRFQGHRFRVYSHKAEALTAFAPNSRMDRIVLISVFPGGLVSDF